MTRYELPGDEETLGKYMYLLWRVLLLARGSTDPVIADLAYALHNLPDLLLRWSDMEEAEQLDALRRVEAKHPQLHGQLTRILQEGAPADWQQKWTRPDET